MQATRTGAAPSMLTIICILVFVAASALLAKHLPRKAPPASSTFTAQCPEILEFETLVITITRDAYGKVSGSCASVSTAPRQRGRH